MKKFFTLFALGGVCFFLANCSSGKKTTTSTGAAPVAEDVAVADVKAKYTHEQMEEGKVLWQSNCKKCHTLFEPGSRTIAKWESVLPSMIRKAKLTDAQGGLIRAYLLTNAKPS